MIILDEFELIKNAVEKADVIRYNNTDLSIKCVYGSFDYLAKFINDKSGIKDAIYPLVFIQTPIESINKKFETIINELKFIIAIKNNNVDISNTDRSNDSFKNIIIPTLQSVVKSLLNNNMKIGEEIKTVKYFNFQSEQKLATQDPWDAMKVQFKLTLNNYCK